ncbi:MAG TPA: methyltransferase domain-containing protein [Acidobacteria bacterium]|nr:methyltransferase domain-containing protein [Acidobacteriota bacterium]
MTDGSTSGNSGAAGADAPKEGLRNKLAKALFGFDPREILRRLLAAEAAAAELRRSLERLQHEVELVRDERVPGLERRADSVEEALRADQGEIARLRDERVPALEHRADNLEAALEAAGREMEILRDERVSTLENRADGLEEVVRLAGREIERVRDHRLPALEGRLDGTETHLAEAVRELDRVRDERLPAAVARQDVLHERLAREQEELGSLVERILLREPLPVPEASPREQQVAEALQTVQPLLLEEFRGGEEEIAHRLERYLPILEGHPPVLDLGCGRGELLLLLREAGIEAAGVEGDPALATAARRRGLVVRQADAVAALREEADGALGAVTAIHLLEHLDPVALLELLAEVRRALRPGGVLAVECPNPHSLRVGAALFWLDPTHVRPLLPETLTLFLRASGFSVETTEYLHPFPDSQSLITEPWDPGDTEGIGGRLAQLERRLDTLLNGFRDFSIVARKPLQGTK